MRVVTIPIVCDGSGAATVYSDPLEGELVALRAVVGTLAALTDLTITEDPSGLAILTITNLAASADYYPRGAPVTAANAAITNAFAKMPVAGRIKVVAAQGGAAGAGSLIAFVED